MSDFEFRATRTQTLRKLGLLTPYAVLGDENGVIIDPYIPGDIRVRPLTSNGYGKSFRVQGPAGTSIQMTPGTPIQLKDAANGRLIVVNYDIAAATINNTDIFAANTPQPASGKFIGQQSIITLLPIPSSPPSMTVYIKSWAPIQGGIEYDFPGASIDLTSFVPSAGNMCLVMIFLKSDYATLEAVASTARGQLDLPLGLADRQECINGRSAGSTPIWAIKLIGGQTSVQQSDIDNGYDRRQSINIDASSSGAGGATFAVPAIVLSTSAAAGSANSVIRSDATIAAFDATNPTASAPGDAVATGSAAFAARRDHKHSREAWGAAGDIGAETFGASAAAGASGKVADAGHVHSMTVARTKLTGPTTYYVRTDGSDSNDGSANNAAHAWLTIQHAIDVASALDNGGNNITIQVGNGTYTGANQLKSFVGSGTITIIGDTTTPSNVVISTTSAACFLADGAGPGIWLLKGMKLQTTTSGSGIYLSNASYVKISDLDFGSCVDYHIVTNFFSSLVALGNYTISGPATFHWLAQFNSAIEAAGITITFTTNPTAFTIFAYATLLGVLYVPLNTFTNKAYATGTRYYVDMNSVIDTVAGGATYLPGNAAGTTQTGGQYT